MDERERPDTQPEAGQATDTTEPQAEEDNASPLIDLTMGDMETDLPQEPEAAGTDQELQQVETEETDEERPPAAEEIEIPWGEAPLLGEQEQEQEESGDESEPAAVAQEVAPETAESPAVAETPAPVKQYKHAWYVVHCYSGYENKVKKGLEQRIQTMGVGDRIYRVVVPVEKEVEIKEGQRRNIERRVFPGYILVEMRELNPGEPDSDEAWYIVRNTPGVTGFVSSGDKPVPLRQEEVDKILKRMETEEPKVHVSFRPGQTVHIIDGPFADFRGQVDNVDMIKGKVRVLVSFFGRETPVELDLLQVEKV